MSKKTVVVGLSGGVDSSVTAALLKEQGYNVIGVTMKLWNGKYKGGSKDACFSPNEKDDIATASTFCQKIDIPYHVFDCSDEYDNTIISYFRDSYSNGHTPNPCVRCNAEFKFGLLPKLAKAKLGHFDYFATGHYANIAKENDRYTIMMAKAANKDLSYFLSRLKQELLSKIMFPLGNITSKAETRALAVKYGLIDISEKDDSQDFYSGDIAELIGKEDKTGNIVDMNGNVLGKHNGHWHYTYGQRKGLNISAKVPLYVVDIKSCHNVVVVGPLEAAYRKNFTVSNINWMLTNPDDISYVKIRSASTLHSGKFSGNMFTANGDVMFGVTPGLTAVFYNDKNEIVSSGYID